MSAVAALDALMSERIVVLDGAWGTMIQARGLAPADYRGTRFADHERDVAGDPDVLNLTRPDVVSEIHRAYLAAGMNGVVGKPIVPAALLSEISRIAGDEPAAEEAAA